MKKLLITAAPILILGVSGAVADTRVADVGFKVALSGIMLAQKDPQTYTNKDGARKADDPAEDQIDMTDPDASPKGHRQKESVTYDIDEKAGPDKPASTAERRASGDTDPRTFKEEDHVGIKSGPTNAPGSVKEEQKDTTGLAPGPKERPGQGPTDERGFKQQDQMGVEGEAKPPKM